MFVRIPKEKKQSSAMTSIGFPCKFDKNVSYVIATFLTPVPKDFVKWVPIHWFNWYVLSCDLEDWILQKYSKCVFFNETLKNKNAINFIQEHLPYYVDQMGEKDWTVLCQNENAISILSQRDENGNLIYRNKINWEVLCLNKNAIDLIKEFTCNMTKNLDKINIGYLCENENAIPLIREFTCNMTKNLDKIDMESLCRNQNAIDLIKEFTNNMKQNINSFDVKYMYGYEQANPFLEKFTNNRTKNVINISISSLCENENAICLIDEYVNNCKFGVNRLNWHSLSCNPNAIDFLYKHLDRIKWRSFSENKNATILLSRLEPNDLEYVFINEICWDYLWSNENAFSFIQSLLQNDRFSRIVYAFIEWKAICSNKNCVYWLHLLTNNFTQLLNLICWKNLSSNNHAFPILELLTNNFTTNLDQIDWEEFCCNTHPKAISIISQNLSKVTSSSCCHYLSRNPNALPLLQKHTSLICVSSLMYNPSIIETQFVFYNILKKKTAQLIYNL
jgi:hypothetical protein